MRLERVNPSVGTTVSLFTYNANIQRTLAGLFELLKKGGLTLNSKYPRVYAPVLRSPLLFHHNTGLSSPTYNSMQPRMSHPTTNLNFPHPTSPYWPQSRHIVQAPLPYNPRSYPYYAVMPNSMPFSSYSIPTATVSSNGLALILIATLILVALDLMIVRPQKR